MFGKLFRSQKRSQPERPTFRPFLESLENRIVPTAADTSTAFFSLAGDVNNLVASLQARPADANAINANLAVVGSDMALLQYTARNFIVPDRLQIDTALITNGIILFYQGFNNLAFIPKDEFVHVVQLGATAVEDGALDLLVAGFFPQTSNDAILA